VVTLKESIGLGGMGKEHHSKRDHGEGKTKRKNRFRSLFTDEGCLPKS